VISRQPVLYSSACCCRTLRSAVVAWLYLTVAPDATTAAVERVTIEPQESDGLLANPGMGWQTFHTFADTDKSLQGLPSSSAHFRFYWREIEPRNGAIDFARFDELLVHAHRAGQQLCFRMMCTGSGQRLDVPSWLKEQGCKGLEFEYGAREEGAHHIALPARQPGTWPLPIVRRARRSGGPVADRQAGHHGSS